MWKNPWIQWFPLPLCGLKGKVRPDERYNFNPNKKLCFWDIFQFDWNYLWTPEICESAAIRFNFSLKRSPVSSLLGPVKLWGVMGLTWGMFFSQHIFQPKGNLAERPTAGCRNSKVFQERYKFEFSMRNLVGWGDTLCASSDYRILPPNEDPCDRPFHFLRPVMLAEWCATPRPVSSFQGPV